MLKRALLVVLIVMAPIPAMALSTDDLIALVSMPLAVAAVSDMTGVPQNRLIDVVTLLNDAVVPPPYFIEVVRYVPVAIVEEQRGTEFVQFLRTEVVTNGVRGEALVPVIEQRFRAVDAVDFPVVVNLRPTTPVVVVDDTFIPTVVRTRVEEVRMHPHGGPPGQLKKIAGVQTGAEIVHGSKPGRERVVEQTPPREERVIVARPKGEKPKIAKPKGDHGRGHGRGHESAVMAPPLTVVPPIVGAPPRGGPPVGEGRGYGGEMGNAKGKGKGKGKD